MTAPTWDDLPDAVRGRILSGGGVPVPVAGGFTPGVRVRVENPGGGGVFVKAVSVRSGAAVAYRAEAEVNGVLPEGLGPALRDAREEDGWIVLVFDLVAGREPDLRPGSADLRPVFGTVAALHDRLTPGPLPTAPAVADSSVLAGVPGRFGGDALLHCDLRADNLLVTGDGEVKVVDWAWAHRGPAWVDTAFLVPQLVLAGHTPAGAEEWARTVPAYRAAGARDIDAFAAALTGYWAGRVGEGPEPLRAYRRRAADAGAAWVRHRAR